jgi:hypothetical protein
MRNLPMTTAEPACFILAVAKKLDDLRSVLIERNFREDCKGVDCPVDAPRLAYIVADSLTEIKEFLDGVKGVCLWENDRGIFEEIVVGVVLAVLEPGRNLVLVLTGVNEVVFMEDLGDGCFHLGLLLLGSIGLQKHFNCIGDIKVHVIWI